MPGRLLRTKLFIPPLRLHRVPRRRLLDRLNQGLGNGHKLSLISAPAGFGKTTIASEWAEALQVRAAEEAGEAVGIAWLSIDDGDNDPYVFMAYLVAALNQAAGIRATLGTEAMEMVRSSRPPPVENILISVINDVVASEVSLLLFLDDYHAIDATAVDDMLAYLVEHLPSQLHLAIITRSDPNLPLARLRARDQLTELRAADLRFSLSESAEFLNQIMGLSLSPNDIAALEARTEGWIAGLQLAAISMQGRPKPSEFVKSFTGGHHYVLDYLVEDVLKQQTLEIQEFLLQTSVLDKLTGVLCDAVTGRHDGQVTLEQLERANLFIVPLDDERRWYRYHHLFADLMRRRLHQTRSEDVANLHRRAGRWYEGKGLADQALRHIFIIEDFQWAGRLVEQIGSAMLWKRGDSHGLRHWLEKLPDELVCSRPRLCLFSAWTSHLAGQPESIEPLLECVESFARQGGDGPAGSAGSTHAIPGPDSGSSGRPYERKFLLAEVSIIRAYMSRVRGNLDLANARFLHALGLLPPEAPRLRGLATGGLAETAFLCGDLADAERLFSEAQAMSLAAGNVYMAAVSTSRLGESQTMRGRLNLAANSYQEIRRRLGRQGTQYPSVLGYAHVGLGQLSYEWNHLDRAVEQLQEGIRCGSQGANARIQLLGYIALSRARQSLGDAIGAVAAIDDATRTWRRYQLTPGWGLPAVDTYRTRLCLAQGDMASAANWVRENGLRTDDELTPLHEVEYITLARVLLAQRKYGEADRLLGRLLEAAEGGGRVAHAIEILILRALSLCNVGHALRAGVALERALTLAEPGGYIRAFVDEGEPIARLLNEVQARGHAQDYVARLLASFPDADLHAGTSSPEPVNQDALFEPLSDRELEVLALVAEGLTNREIGERMYLSPNTVKVHTRNIYGKLDTHSRTQAVASARALGILPSLHRRQT